MTPVEVSNRVIDLIFLDPEGKRFPHYPQDWNTNDQVTMGKWKAAIVTAVLEFQQQHQEALDALDIKWRARMG